MAKKKITIPTKTISSYQPMPKEIDKKLDEWVSGKKEVAEFDDEKKPSPSDQQVGSTFRFTVVVPTILHRRIKRACAISGISMKDKLIEVLEKHFPEV